MFRFLCCALMIAIGLTGFAAMAEAIDNEYSKQYSPNTIELPQTLQVENENVEHFVDHRAGLFRGRAACAPGSACDVASYQSIKQAPPMQAPYQQAPSKSYSVGACNGNSAGACGGNSSGGLFSGRQARMSRRAARRGGGCS